MNSMDVGSTLGHGIQVDTHLSENYTTHPNAYTYAELFDDALFTSKALELVRAERRTPVVITMDNSLRVKATDNCGMTCTFCHNEGTGVANPEQVKRGRVSVFQHFNLVNFIPGFVVPNDEFVRALNLMQIHTDARELHWTGGEPTLHIQIADLTAIALARGFAVKMTSNGETGALKMADLSRSGLSSVNFSIFGTTPEELAAVQADHYKKVENAAKKLSKLDEAIRGAHAYGIDVKANIVMSDSTHEQRLLHIIERYSDTASIRILDNLSDDNFESPIAIYEFLAKLRAIPLERRLTAGASGSMTIYLLPNKKRIGFKQIRPARLPSTCSTCSMNNNKDCREGYYGVRMYVDNQGKYRVGVCLQRMDLTIPIDEFVRSGLPNEIRALRMQELNDLQRIYGDRNCQVIVK